MEEKKRIESLLQIDKFNERLKEEKQEQIEKKNEWKDYLFIHCTCGHKQLL